jgi:alpha-methylacyl-CoA racemase
MPTETTPVAGPLAGYRILEVAGIGPGPFCAMMLADMGAEIVRIDRASGRTRSLEMDVGRDVSARGRSSLALDLKHPAAVSAVLRLCERADGLIEGFRPGVMERLGLGPEPCMAANPRLVYGRMTGWGQTGPLAQEAGHDVNYLALSGILHMLGRADERPLPPLNLVADMGGGGLMLAFGMACALLERVRSGRGQVVDAAMAEGAALLATSVFAQKATGWWRAERGSNLLDSGAHFYEVYVTRDDKYMAVGAIEPQFYARLLQGLGLDPQGLPPQMERSAWPTMKQRFAEVFRARTRDEWTAVFAASDACVSPVLTPEEAVHHPQALARQSFRHSQGVLHPSAAPRFSRSTTGADGAPPLPGEQSTAVLESFGFSAEEIAQLCECGAVRQAARRGSV